MASRALSALVLAVMATLLLGGGAQAAVVSDQGVQAGVRFAPGTTAPSGVQVEAATAPAPCDPWLSSDLRLRPGGLCSHGGPVMHGNETFVLTWDPDRTYWQTTRYYVEQFLRNVADASRDLGSPYAVTSQYADGPPGQDPGNNPNRAANQSVFGGACIDYGVPGHMNCHFPEGNFTGQGADYPSSAGAEGDCPPPPPVTTTTTTTSSSTTTSVSTTSSSTSSTTTTSTTTAKPPPWTPPSVCITDGAIRNELKSLVDQTHLYPTYVQPGYAPLLVVLVPDNVEVCLDGGRRACSADFLRNGFCSYHGVLDNPKIPYVVQPWTAGSRCDELDLPQQPDPAVEAGQRLVSPLSQSHIAAIVNPWLNGWFAASGAEINDNGCVPLPLTADVVQVGDTKYHLQHEFNNGGLIQIDPNSPPCAGSVLLTPRFVPPSPVDAGKQTWFDGSVSASTLVVPDVDYRWDFGDGSAGVSGASVLHTFQYGGSYTVTLTVEDRGGNSRTFTHTVDVLGQSRPSSGGSGAQARIALMPQGLQSVLRHGIALRLRTDHAADGVATVLIPRGAARRVHIRAGRGPSVIVGRGTLSGIHAGTVDLRLRISGPVAKKLARLRHVTLTIRLTLVAADRSRMTLNAAGRY
jgi:PKD repeat protein